MSTPETAFSSLNGSKLKTAILSGANTETSELNKSKLETTGQNQRMLQVQPEAETLVREEVALSNEHGNTTRPGWIRINAQKASLAYFRGRKNLNEPIAFYSKDEHDSSDWYKLYAGSPIVETTNPRDFKVNTLDVKIPHHIWVDNQSVPATYELRLFYYPEMNELVETSKLIRVYNSADLPPKQTDPIKPNNKTTNPFKIIFGQE